MRIKDYYLKTKNTIEENRKIIYICSLIFTLAFSIFNTILGIVKESIWHETISIYSHKVIYDYSKRGIKVITCLSQLHKEVKL